MTGVTATGTRKFAIATEGVLYGGTDLTTDIYGGPCTINTAAFSPLQN
jgi:hypothetical protein